MSFDYLKHIIRESDELLLLIGCSLILALFIAKIVINKFLDLLNRR